MEFIRYIGKNFWIVYIILITVFCYELASLSSSLIKLFAIPVQAKPAVQDGGGTAESDEPASPVNDYKIITERNIFNTPAETNMQAKLKKIDLKNINLDNIPLSQSGMQLLGTMQGDNANTLAVIKRGEDIRVYHAEDPVQGGRVLSILRRAVILEMNGNIEKLLLDIGQVSIINLNSASATTRSKSGNTAAPAIAGNRTIERSSLRLDNMGDFMSQMRLIPIMTPDNKTEGYRAEAIKPGSIISKIGISNGDVIKSINGAKIEKPEDAFEAYQKLLKENNITLVVLRGGSEITLNYELRD